MKLALLMLLLAATPAWATPVSDAVSAKIRAVLPADLGLVSVELPSTTPPDGVVGIEWRGTPRAGRASVLFSVGTRKLWARVTLAPLRDVAVLRRPLAAGAAVTADDIRVEKRAAAAAAPPRVGQTVRRDVVAGAVLEGADVERGAVQPRGTSLRIVARKGGVMVAMQGTLEVAARLGEPAVARLADGSRLVRGRLESPSVFIVEAARE